MTKKFFATALAVALAGPLGPVAQAFAAETATLSVSKIKDLNIRMYGFVETDFIHDTTQSFFEEEGNNPVTPRVTAGGTANNFGGLYHRSIMSVRNSRLGFDLTVPKTDAGLATQGIIELDMMGNNGPNVNPGTTPAPGSAPPGQSERDFFNNPAVRVRHALLNLTYRDDWNAKVGQTWSLLGWQPHYFPGETIVQPGPAQLYRRFAQIRLTHTYKVLPDWTWESAADIAKPAEMNSGNPEVHWGFRLASTKYKAASIGGAGTSMEGLSAAVSGALIPLRTNGIGNRTGTAVAVDVAVPLIPSTDGKDRSNNLVWMGEAMAGSGVGGLEYSGLSLGVGQIKNTTPNAGTSIDSGIAGINAVSGNSELVQYRAFRNHIQYSLPGGKWAFSGGYGQVEGRNLDRFATTSATNVSLIPKIQFGYVSAFYDPLSWLRFGAEMNQTRDSYNDSSNRTATNNRFQFTTFFVF